MSAHPLSVRSAAALTARERPYAAAAVDAALFSGGLTEAARQTLGRTERRAEPAKPAPQDVARGAEAGHGGRPGLARPLSEGLTRPPEHALVQERAAELGLGEPGNTIGQRGVTPHVSSRHTTAHLSESSGWTFLPGRRQNGRRITAPGSLCAAMPGNAGRSAADRYQSLFDLYAQAFDPTTPPTEARLPSRPSI